MPVEAVEGFSKVWKTPGGLSIMLDSATKQFALDFARVTLRSFIIANTQAAQKAVAAARAAQSNSEQTAQSASTKSGIVLTD